MIFHFLPKHQAASISNWQQTECKMLFTAMEDDASRTAVREARKIAPIANRPAAKHKRCSDMCIPRKTDMKFSLLLLLVGAPLCLPGRHLPLRCLPALPLQYAARCCRASAELSDRVSRVIRRTSYIIRAAVYDLLKLAKSSSGKALEYLVVFKRIEKERRVRGYTYCLELGSARLP
jgi:hypothetical protein